MPQTKAELKREIQLLRKRFKEMEELLQQTAIKAEQLQGAYDATVADTAERKNLPMFELPPIIVHRS
jgi:ABC-type transporter Mla subunit MlaD